MPRTQRAPDPAQCHKRHACHAKHRCMSLSALPRKVSWRAGRPAGPKRATRPSPVPYVPHLQRKVQVDVAKYHACHACHAKMVCDQACHAKMVCDKVVCDKAKVVYERWCVTKLCVCVTKWFVKGGVRQSGVKAVCERWCVTKRCVTKLRVKNGV